MIYEPEEIARGVVMRITTSEIDLLCDKLNHVIEACEYAANDLVERADYEDKHSHCDDSADEQSKEYNAAAEAFTETAADIAALRDALKLADKEQEDEESEVA